MKLDLHGKSHHDVFREVDKFIWSCMKKNLSEFQIITGNSEKIYCYDIFYHILILLPL